MLGAMSTPETNQEKHHTLAFVVVAAAAGALVTKYSDEIGDFVWQGLTDFVGSSGDH